MALEQSIGLLTREGIVTHTPTLEQYINETWDLFIEGVGVQDTGFDSLDELVSED